MMRFTACVLAALGLSACDVPPSPGAAEGEGEAREGEGEGEGEEGEGEGEGEGDGDGEGEGEEGEGEAPACNTSADAVVCAHSTVVVADGLLGRDVHFALPRGTPPAAGWPVVVFFQGSLFSAEFSFDASVDDAFGRFELARTVSALLDAGFAVIAPEALGEGTTAWQTNVPPASLLWEGSSDDQLMLALFAAFDGSGKDAVFGDVDGDRLYATGISSGGFMTSRMAVSYPGRFRALAIHSGGYATCSALCLLPSLPADHPPTFFVHGAADLVVTAAIMELYRDALDDEGVEVDSVIVEGGAHEWLAAAVTAVPSWFLAR